MSKKSTCTLKLGTSTSSVTQIWRLLILHSSLDPQDASKEICISRQFYPKKSDEKGRRVPNSKFYRHVKRRTHAAHVRRSFGIDRDKASPGPDKRIKEMEDFLSRLGGATRVVTQQYFLMQSPSAPIIRWSYRCVRGFMSRFVFNFGGCHIGFLLAAH